MGFERFLVAKIANEPALANLIGDRVFPVLCPQEYVARPHVTFRRTSTQRDKHTKGGSDQLDRASVELRCWSDDYDQAWKMSDGIIATLSGFQGTLGEQFVQRLFVEDQADDPEIEQDGSERIFYCVVVSITAHFAT